MLVPHGKKTILKVFHWKKKHEQSPSTLVTRQANFENSISYLYIFSIVQYACNNANIGQVPEFKTVAAKLEVEITLEWQEIG